MCADSKTSVQRTNNGSLNHNNDFLVQVHTMHTKVFEVSEGVCMHKHTAAKNVWWYAQRDHSGKAPPNLLRYDFIIS